MAFDQETTPVLGLMVIPGCPPAEIDQVPEALALGVLEVNGPPHVAVCGGMGLIVGSGPNGTLMDITPVPGETAQELVSCSVTEYALPLATGLGQLTTPVEELMVMPG